MPWWAFSESLSRATTSIVEHRNLVKKVVFPLELLPVTICVSSSITEIIGLTILIVAVFLITGHIGLTILLVPILLIFQVILTTGLSWFIASLGVFYRDMTQVVNIILTTWMFLTPIFYDADRIPDQFRWLVLVNPMTWLITAYRSVLLDVQVPNLGQTVLFMITSGVVIILGHYWFYRTRRIFADVL